MTSCRCGRSSCSKGCGKKTPGPTGATGATGATGPCCTGATGATGGFPITPESPAAGGGPFKFAMRLGDWGGPGTSPASLADDGWDPPVPDAIMGDGAPAPSYPITRRTVLNELFVNLSIPNLLSGISTDVVLGFQLLRNGVPVGTPVLFPSTGVEATIADAGQTRKGAIFDDVVYEPFDLMTVRVFGGPFLGADPESRVSVIASGRFYTNALPPCPPPAPPSPPSPGPTGATGPTGTAAPCDASAVNCGIPPTPGPFEVFDAVGGMRIGTIPGGQPLLVLELGPSSPAGAWYRISAANAPSAWIFVPSLTGFTGCPGPADPNGGGTSPIVVQMV